MLARENDIKKYAQNIFDVGRLYLTVQ